jgi:hypothetical protein
MQPNRTTHLNSTSLKFQFVIFLLYDVQIISATLYTTYLVSHTGHPFDMDNET